MAQSTNDTFPTAMRIATLFMIRETLPAMDHLAQAFEAKGREFDHILKSGRTHLQDATPIRLGQEFAAYGLTVRRDIERLERAQETLYELNIGGTAVGTGLNAEEGYIDGIVRYLAELTGFPLRRAESLVQIAPSMASFAEVSGMTRVLALDLTKIANDLRLLASGPATGLYEIILPPVQPGSSIMPGKINPVHRRDGQSGLLPGAGQRHDRQLCGAGGTARAQRDDAGHHPQRALVATHPQERHDRPGGSLRLRHQGER